MQSNGARFEAPRMRASARKCETRRLVALLLGRYSCARVSFISRFAACLAFVSIACATGQDLPNTSYEPIPLGNPSDSGTATSGEGGATESGGAPSTGGATSSAGGVTSSAGGASGSASGGANASGGATGKGGTASGGMLASGGATTDTGGAPGAGGACATGQKPCADACVVQTPMNGCSAASCTACPIPAPANGLQVCDAQGQCNFECLSGFQKNGNQCGQSTDGGAGGGGGAGGALTCGTRTCRSCIGNLVSCCTRDGDRCQCVLPNATNLCQ